MAQSSVAAERDRIVEYLERELVGPRRGDTEIVTEGRPEGFYSAGIIYPVTQNRLGTLSLDPIGNVQDEDQVDALAAGTSDLEARLSDSADQDQNYLDDAVVLAGNYRPSAIGISFRITGPDLSLHVRVSGATYAAAPKNSGKRESWQRTSFSQAVDLPAPSGSTETGASLPGVPVTLRVVWRMRSDHALVTLTLVNTERIDYDEWPRTEQCFFQAQMRVEPLHPAASFTRFQDVASQSPDPEERELELLYRKHASFGAGHGCALQWDEPAGIPVTRHLRTEIIPRYSVRPLDYSLPEADAQKPELRQVLSTAYLATGSDDVLDSLEALCDVYAQWVSNLPGHPENADIPAYLTTERDRLLARAQSVAGRMREGVVALRDNPTAREAFQLANRSMMMQSRHSRTDLGGTPRIAPLPTYTEPDYNADGPMVWRPFQLAFLLLNITSITDPTSPDRNIVDLIWFPTGGGKTEAYLGVSAFSIFYRRLCYRSSGGGTVVLMRYSLRLLTSQQFERASALICACEVLRSQDEARLGQERISIGLWIGAAGTPNTYAQAIRALDDAGRENPFPVRRCPWCGMQITIGPANDSSTGGIDASSGDFRLFCPQPGCPFASGLPINFIDQYLYLNPPTLLIGVVDKFAQLPWDSRASAFFGLPAASGRRPPELIIQDELHLMSGPLGTIVGLYETAVDEMCQRDTVGAKIIASTATIRRAAEQVRCLYAREVLQFPPAGLHADDSYFARTSNDEGRLYIGALLPGITSTTAAIRTFAALLQAPKELNLTGTALDTFWTLVAYFNSLRELGKAETLATDDIPARMRVIATTRQTERAIPALSIRNLTSQSTDNVASILERLKLEYTDRNAIALLLASSMLSVGVDVSRLGLMVVNGQPKSTSEYIQASSRVGREAGRPGLVVTLYSNTKPRDRSHYERFQDFHAAFYRHVEPTSVTPFAPPARARALRAVLVALARHLVPGLSADDQAREVTGATGQRLIDMILRRIDLIDSKEKEAARIELESALQQWLSWAGNASTPLHYSARTMQFRDLLKEATASGPAWPTLRSMRNVDVETLLRPMN